MLCGHTIRGMIVTAIIGRIVLSRRTVEFASAGHCAPFHVSGEHGPVELKLRGSPPLGILPELPAHSQSTTLAPGDWMVVYTDGLSESFNAEEVPLDPAGIARILTQSFRTPADVVDALNLGELNHRQQAEPSDDLTVLVFGFK
jgi:sigma-B regulation protein RsbU (phosphoserine phosphatase)